jgi:uncharacterized membrane protein
MKELENAMVIIVSVGDVSNHHERTRKRNLYAMVIHYPIFIIEEQKRRYYETHAPRKKKANLARSYDCLDLSCYLSQIRPIGEVMSIESILAAENFLMLAKKRFFYTASKVFASKAFFQMKMIVRCWTQQPTNGSFLHQQPS